jgi:hypothetical protein
MLTEILSVYSSESPPLENIIDTIHNIETTIINDGNRGIHTITQKPTAVAVKNMFFENLLFAIADAVAIANTIATGIR